MNGNNETKASVMFPCVKCRTLNKLEIIMKAAPAEPEKKEEPRQTKHEEAKPDEQGKPESRESDSVRPDGAKGRTAKADAVPKPKDSKPVTDNTKSGGQ